MSVDDSLGYDLLDRLAEEFAARIRRGERPAVKSYTDRYPELAGEPPNYPVDLLWRAGDNRQRRGRGVHVKTSRLHVPKVGCRNRARGAGRAVNENLHHINERCDPHSGGDRAGR
jgi:hypothetical protein